MTATVDRIVVVKVGSNVLMGPGGGLDREFIGRIANQVAAIARGGWRPVVVSSGAVASGVATIHRHIGEGHSLPERQALAAIGQAGLIGAWQEALGAHGLVAAQVLLGNDDFDDRLRFLNLTATLRSLFALSGVPIVNENDCVSVEELAFGDNDRLSALVASQLDAHWLIMLTDVEGCYERDPRADPDAQLLERIDRLDPGLVEGIGGAGSVGRGGMRSKLEAAQLASRAGVRVAICHAREDRVVERLLAGEAIGTAIPARDRDQVDRRRRWLALGRSIKGTIRVDDGAARALARDGSSLLPVGVVAVDERFERGDTVEIRDRDGSKVLARGLASLAADELDRIKGMRMDAAAELLGYALPKAAVHRDNLLLENHP